MEQSCCCRPPRLPAPSAGPAVGAVLEDDISGKLRCRGIGLDWSKSAPPVRIGCPRDPSRAETEPTKLAFFEEIKILVLFSSEQRTNSVQRYYVLTVGREGLQTGRGYPMVLYALQRQETRPRARAPACSCARVLLLVLSGGLPGRPGRPPPSPAGRTAQLPQRPPGGLAHSVSTKPKRSHVASSVLGARAVPSPLKSHLSLSCSSFRVNSG